MRLLLIDDEPEHVESVTGILRDALDATVDVVPSVERALTLLGEHTYDLVVADIFIPLDDAPPRALGARARDFQETVQHLGGLVLLDELDRMPSPPPVLAHTACTDFDLIEILGERVVDRVPKPAPVEVLLKAILGALDLPTPQ